MDAEILRDARGVPIGYTSVTTVLSAYSGLGDIDKEVLKKAADRGTRAHKLCEMYAKGLLVVDPEPDCMGYIEAFKAWYDAMCIKPLYLEHRLDSAKHRLSGGVDMIAILRGDTEPTIIDIKTPVNASKTWRLQTAAYKMLAEEELGLKIGRRIALQLPRDGLKAKVIEYTEHAKDQDLYLKALEVYRYFNP